MKQLLLLLLLVLLVVPDQEVRRRPIVAAGGGGGGGGRSAIFNGTSSSANGPPADAGDVPAAQADWRFMVKLHDLAPDAGENTYIFNSSPGDLLILYISATAPGSYTLNCFAGGGLASSGSVSWSTTDDVVIQVRATTAGAGEVSLEVWNWAGSSLGSNRNTASATTNTAFFQNYAIGSTGSSAGWLEGKVAKALFITGAGSYGAAMPDVEVTTGDILQWTFDADTGEDSVSTADLTLTNVTFGNTP